MARIIECKHPYGNNQLATEELVFEGAVGLQLAFDPRSCMEEGCDYITFYTDPSRKTLVPDSEQRYSGKYTSSGKNYPTIEKPLSVKGDRVTVHFIRSVRREKEKGELVGH